jgi:hypothetical protein
MVGFVFIAQPFQNADGFIHEGGSTMTVWKRRSRALSFFDVFAVFIQGCGADALQLAARQSRFKHIRSVHRTFRRACAHQGM